MKHRLFIPYLFFCIYLIALYSQGCKKDNCPNGYESEKGKCMCPTGKHETKGLCKGLDDREYFGTTDCACKDSAFFKVSQPYFEPISGDTVITITKLQGVLNSNSTGTYSNKYEFGLIRTPSGDSLKGREEWGVSPCPINGFHTGFRLSAKFLDSKTLKIYMYNETNYPIEMKYLRDTCIYICRR